MALKHCIVALLVVLLGGQALAQTPPAIITTRPLGDNSAFMANTGYVDQTISALLSGSPNFTGSPRKNGIPLATLNDVGGAGLGTWNASTNTPTLTSTPSNVTVGNYYRVSVAGSTNLGCTNPTCPTWAVGDLLVATGTQGSPATGWAKVANAAVVSSVNNQTGAVVLPLFSGAYADLTGKPTLFSGSYTDLTNRPALVASALTDTTNAGNITAGTLPYARLPVGTVANTVAAANDARITGAAQTSNNLSDLVSASSARANLGLGGSSTLNVGTASGTVVAGDDGRLSNNLRTNNNLSDLANASSARANLGLGGASTLNVGTTTGTVAAGNDARITGASQAANNLSDLTSAIAARTNLGVSDLLSPGETIGTAPTLNPFLSREVIKSPMTYGQYNAAVASSIVANTDSVATLNPAYPYQYDGTGRMVYAGDAEILGGALPVFGIYGDRDSVTQYKANYSPPPLTQVAGNFTSTTFTPNSPLSAAVVAKLRVGMFMDVLDGDLVVQKWTGRISSFASDGSSVTSADGWYYVNANGISGKPASGTKGTPTNGMTVTFNPATKTWVQNDNIYLYPQSWARAMSLYEGGIIQNKQEMYGITGLDTGFPRAQGFDVATGGQYKVASAYRARLGTGQFVNPFISEATGYQGTFTILGDGPGGDRNGFLSAQTTGNPFLLQPPTGARFIVNPYGNVSIGAADSSYTGGGILDLRNGYGNAYDVRLLGQGGTNGTPGAGTLTVQAAALNVLGTTGSGVQTATGASPQIIPTAANTSMTFAATGTGAATLASQGGPVQLSGTNVALDTSGNLTLGGAVTANTGNSTFNSVTVSGSTFNGTGNIFKSGFAGFGLWGTESGTTDSARRVQVFNYGGTFTVQRLNLDGSYQSNDFSIGPNHVSTFGNAAGATTSVTPGSSTLTVSSDSRLKTDIEDAPAALPQLDDAMKTYRWTKGGKAGYGPIAQDVLQKHPERVRMNDAGFYELDAPSPFLLEKAIQELSAANDNLRFELRVTQIVGLLGLGLLALGSRGRRLAA